MRIDKLQQFLESELSYPVSHGSVIEQIGAVEIEAPDEGETERVSNVIDSVGQDFYGSAEELFSTVIGNVGDEFIGRKFYDDRGDNPADISAGPEEKTNVSF